MAIAEQVMWRTSPLDQPGERIAFVFEGGGSLTATQVGALRSLNETGIVPDFVIGTSAGAINAVAFATDPTAEGVARLDALWRALRTTDLVGFSLADLLRGVSGRRDWLVADTRLRRFLRRELPLARLEDAVIPVHVVATDVATGDAQLISRGDAVEALLASAAFPGVFPPVTIAGRTLVDGGVSANAPVAQAASLGATEIYLLPAASPAPAPGTGHGALELAFRSLSYLHHQELESAAAIAGPRLRILPAVTTPTSNILDFRQSAQLMDESYRRTSAWITAGRRHLAPVA